MSFLQADNGDEVRTHLNACQKLWRLADGKKPFEIVEQAELYDALVPVFRRDQVAKLPAESVSMAAIKGEETVLTVPSSSSILK